MLHILLALVSGIVIETLYALGVILISERRALVSAALSVAWGASFLLGVNESFKSWMAAVAWCVGLGIGTVAGVWLGRKRADDDLTPEEIAEVRRLLSQLSAKLR